MKSRSLEGTTSGTDKRKRNGSLVHAFVACTLVGASACMWSGCGGGPTLPPCDFAIIGVPPENFEGACSVDPPTQLDVPSDNDVFEEFVGPFPSWKNVKDDFGAKGDGSTDDTDAIQAALDWFKPMSSAEFGVLYFPKGTYRITRTLVTSRYDTIGQYVPSNFNGFSIIGEDPANTIIAWDGPCKGTMMHLDISYGKVSRLSFHGRTMRDGEIRGNAAVGIYRGHTFSTATELSDLWFQDLNVGMHMGTSNASGCGVYKGQAEEAIFRCRFTNCSDSGLFVTNSNSLDIWVWRSQFDRCKFGVHSDQGNFHVYDSFFHDSQEADIWTENLNTFAFVNNTSVRSREFLRQNEQTQGSRMLVQGNRIFEWDAAQAIETRAAGSLLLLDNFFQPRSADPNPVAMRLTADNQVLVSNRFTFANAVRTIMPPPRIRDIDSQVVETITPIPELPLPQAPPKRKRAEFEVTRIPEGDHAAIQNQINLAAAELPDTRPVVHIPKGKWILDKPLIVPPNVDMQIVGDGVETGTMIFGDAITTGEAVIKVQGPSRAVLRDFEVIGRDDRTGPFSCGGILVEDADPEEPLKRARIYGEQVNARTADAANTKPDTDIFINEVENADVIFIASGFSGAGKGIKVRGGPKRRSGIAADGLIAFISGASSATGKLYDVFDGGELVAEAVWYEGAWDGDEMIAKLENTSGSLTLAAMHFAVPTTTLRPVIRSVNHRGDMTVLVSLFMQQASLPPAHYMELMGDGSASRALMMGDTFFVTALKPDMTFVDANWVWRDTTTPMAQAALFHPQLHSGTTGVLSSNTVAMNLPNVVTNIPTQQPQDFDNYVISMVQPLRDASKRIGPYSDTPHGADDVTSLGLFRVFARAGRGKNHIEIRRPSP